MKYIKTVFAAVTLAFAVNVSAADFKVCDMRVATKSSEPKTVISAAHIVDFGDHFKVVAAGKSLETPVLDEYDAGTHTKHTTVNGIFLGMRPGYALEYIVAYKKEGVTLGFLNCVDE